MQFLKTIFWAFVAVVVAIFAYNNWTPVTLNLWNGLLLDTKLPVLLFIAFLIGLLPTFLVHRATRWRLRRKLESVERTLADVRTSPSPSMSPAVVPPTATPMAVPPGVA
jgi:lipopolysaccharide assembly protein A